jgi:hypothetical protein
MIDEEWLESLDFVGVNDLHFKGLAGVGGLAINLIAFDASGDKFVIKVRRHHLGFHIREIPLFMSGRALYDVDRVNRKLLKLVGNDNFDEMTSEYDTMFDKLVAAFHEERHDDPASVPAIGHRLAPQCPDAWPFLFGTAMMRRRMTDLSAVSWALPEGVNDEIENAIGLRKLQLDLSWRSIPRLTPLAPEALSKNPLFIWGGAAMDGFFTDEEFPRIVMYLDATFGRLRTSPDADLYLKQITLVAAALKSINCGEVDRLVKLCRALGFEIAIPSQ